MQYIVKVYKVLNVTASRLINNINVILFSRDRERGGGCHCRVYCQPRQRARWRLSLQGVLSAQTESEVESVTAGCTVSPDRERGGLSLQGVLSAQTESEVGCHCRVH